MTLIDKFIRSQLELTKPMQDAAPLESARSFHEKIGKLMHFSRRKDVVVFDDYFEGIKASLIVPRDELRGGVLIYLHGGGYVCGGFEAARGFASLLSAECGMRAVSLDYRLAPENPYPAAIEDALLLYHRVVETGTPPERIILAGDSAGGGLCYALALKLKELGECQPAGIIAMSPWVDLTLSGESYTHNREADPSLTIDRLIYYADCYVGEDYCKPHIGAKPKKGSHARTTAKSEMKKNPLISPIFADLSGLAPSLIFAGGDEILLSDAERMKERLTEAGVSATLIVRPEMWHDYTLYCLKRFKSDFTEMSAFVRRVMPRDNERKLKWMQIDNQGKLYPASRTSRWYNVFRLSMTLTEDVDREVLQSALDVTVRRFPSIAVRLRRGVFWYYLEEIPHAPIIQDEKSYPLARMPFDDIRQCAFRVIVYKKRISCEFFHAITDGSGAMVFLKTLVAEYLTQRYGISIPPSDGVLDRLEPPRPEEYLDQFFNFKSGATKSRKETDSYRIRGVAERDGFCHATTFILRSEELVSYARSLGVTVTSVLAAVFTLAAIRLQERDIIHRRNHKEIKVLLPCDLRRLYGVDTLRNFIMYVTPAIDPRLGEYTVEEIAGIIHKKMALEITKKNMSAMISTNVRDEENIFNKIAPLFLKNVVMKLFFMLFGEKKSTLTLSNLGVVRLPSEMEPYIDRVDFILAPQSSGPYNAGVVSYRDTLYLNIIRNIVEPKLERELYSILRECGIHVKLESNER